MSFNIVNVILSGEVKVPISILPKLLLITEKVGLNEVGLYLKSELDFTSNNKVVATISSEKEFFYLPKQKVSPVGIDFNESKPKWCNTVLHRHPDGCIRFSGTDIEYLNQEFEVSVLYIPEAKLPDAIINVKVTDTLWVQVKAAARFYNDTEFNVDEIISKIDLQPQSKNLVRKNLLGQINHQLPPNVKNYGLLQREINEDDLERQFYERPYSALRRKQTELSNDDLFGQLDDELQI